MNEEDYSDIEGNTDENIDYQMDNDEIDGAEEGFLKGYEDADDYNKEAEDEFDEDDEIKK